MSVPEYESAIQRAVIHTGVRHKDMPRKLRVAIDCRIGDPRQGTGTAVLALAKALSDSDVAEQEYTFIVREKLRKWLSPNIFGPCSLETIPDAQSSGLRQTVRRIAAFRRIPQPIRYIQRKLRRREHTPPVSDGYVESRGFDVVHFPTQAAYRTELPSIYQPWDLQHLHYPKFFSDDEFARREREYRTFCDQATYVCVQAEWTKKDLIKQYGIADGRVVVIPWASIFDAYVSPTPEQVSGVVTRLNLPERFFFYPAVTWPHKNHEIIFQALATLKSKEGIKPHVFFTGASTDHRSTLDKLALRLGISDQLHFLGFVTPTELQAIFKSATAMIFPSKFEGFGLPVLEAFNAELPVLASNATTLPEVARDGAMYFDPESSLELSARMKEILYEPELRRDLKERGSRVLETYSMRDMITRFQSLYERTAAERKGRNG